MPDQQKQFDFDSKKLPDTLPILPLYDTVLFPKMVLPLVVMQKESVQLIDEAMSKDRIIGLLVSKVTSDEKTSNGDDLYKVGTSALILKMAKTEDEKSQILVQGLGRFKLGAFIEEKPYLMGQVVHLQENELKDTETQALMSNIIHLFTKVVDLSPVLPPEVSLMAKSIQEPGTLANMVASSINATPA
jgi:ATP-dependent Lon protease